MKVYLEYSKWNNEIHLYLVKRNWQGKTQIVKPMKLELKEYKEGQAEEPSLIIPNVLNEDESFLQSLFDALEEAGYKSKRIEENESKLTATKYHLEDMRKLVFKEQVEGEGE